MLHFHAPSDCHVEYREIPIGEHRGKAHTMRALIVRPKDQKEKAPGVLWLHGGGYVSGFPEMAYFSRAIDLVVGAGAVIVCPNYRKALTNPYPAAIKDCYRALVYVKEHAEELNIDDTRICVGGESAGGGLCAAICMMARDRGDVKVAFQMPLYPMISNIDTESSRDNHGRVWNTRKNHIGWQFYLRGKAKKKVSPYASPAQQDDYSGLPPAYTFVGDGEPFYTETLQYVENLRAAGVPAEVDVYHTDMHAFDMLRPDEEQSRKATRRFKDHFAYALAHYCGTHSGNKDL